MTSSGISAFGPVDSDVSPALLALAQQQPVSVSTSVTNSLASVVGHGSKASAVSTTGTTFAAGADLLASAISFVADGTSDYGVTVSAPGSFTNTNATGFELRLNLDAADQGKIARFDGETPPVERPFAARTIMSGLAAGSHTVNARLISFGVSTATISAGAGGAATERSILITVEKLA